MKEYFIKINDYVTFEDVTVYSKNDTVRNKSNYMANVSGLEIHITNMLHKEGKMQCICKGLGLSITFTNVNISFEAAMKAGILKVSEKLILISKNLTL